ncbi:hypothetical protein ART_3032 [Arthrobacter sp. PAMC 25486]|uniref:hypothetical protein n=1 Tax=Arthrobacter sp. PAMC 25486 TaxID=1494608 RepID=UPI000535EAF0|nr:hypothetical protein [Arthrobacter sp. PAMC 25486]AIY02631.1 hypothetical protein ART_3032 [Arthrobacter sp. PAMC 25486]
MTSQPDTSPPEITAGEPRKLQVRRAPKYVPFLIAGGLAGVATAALFTFLLPSDGDFAATSVFGLFAVLMVLPGVGLGALVALILDHQGRRKTKTLLVESLPDDNSNAEAETA